MATPAPCSGDPSSPTVLCAFALGWHMSELYTGPIQAQKPEYARAPSNLPGLGDLEGYELVKLSIEQIGAELHLLSGPSGGAGIDLPPLPRSVLDHGSADTSATPKRDLLLFHLDLLEKLTAVDFRLGKAYGLGRALADTSLLPDPKEPDTFTDAFNPERIETLTGWLGDLSADLPPYAAAAASHSLKAWVGWVSNPTIDEQRVDISEGGEDLTRALHAQGRLWRGLLSGERLGTVLLGVDDYVAAARRMVTQTAGIASQFLKTWWRWVALAVLIVAGLLVLIYVGLSGSSKTVTAIITILGALGLSWKGVSASLGKVIGKTEPHLWEAEVEAAVCNSATWLPRRWPGLPKQPAQGERAASGPSEEATQS
jgi:hypothetical protein